MSKRISATIYHKDTPTLTFYMNDNGKCVKVLSVQNAPHVPVGVTDAVHTVNRWLNERSLDLNRRDVIRIRDLGIFNEEDFIPFHFLSPLDSYFIKYRGENMPYNSIDLMDNDYKADIFSITEDTESVSRDSGNLGLSFPYEVYSIPRNEDDERRLFIEEPMDVDSLYLQEKYADEVSVLEGRYSEYGDKLYFDVRNITDKSLEYIPLQDYFNMFWEDPVNAGYTREEALVNMLREYDFPDYEEAIPRIMYLDKLYGIEHSLMETGVLRNPDTLEIRMIAPLFCYRKPR